MSLIYLDVVMRCCVDIIKKSEIMVKFIRNTEWGDFLSGATTPSSSFMSVDLSMKNGQQGVLLHHSLQTGLFFIISMQHL